MTGQIAGDRWNWRLNDLADDIDPFAFQSFLERVAGQTAALPGAQAFDYDAATAIAAIFDNPEVPDSYLWAVSQLSTQQINNYLNANPDLDAAAAFPNRLQDANHLVGTETLMGIFGFDQAFWSEKAAGQGYTGADGSFIHRTENPYLGQGTILHDLTSFLDDVLRYTIENDPNFRAAHGKKIIHDGETDADATNLNKELFGSSSIEYSAFWMAAQTYLDSLEDFLIPDSTELFTFMGPGVTKEFLQSRIWDEQQPAFKDAVTKLGGAAGKIASQLAYYYGDDGTAFEVVSASFAETLAGFLGDSIIYDTVNVNLPNQVILSRFTTDFTDDLTNLAAQGLGATLIESFDITNPLGQFVTQSVTTTSTNLLVDEALEGAIDVGLFSQDFAERYLGYTELSFSRPTLVGNIVGELYTGFGGFVQTRVFSYIDELWTDVNLSNLGSGIGGVLGNFFAPGIGGFVGQVVGGYLFDLFDGEPRSFHRVRYDDANEEFVREFVFARDDGDVALSDNLSASALGAVSLAASIIGGTITSAGIVEYGHYEDEFVYSLGGNRTGFSTPEELLDRGVLAQLRTISFEGANPYALALIQNGAYAPTLDQLFEDLDGADFYYLHQSDPELFGEQIANIDDPGARALLIRNWEATMAEAERLGLRDLDFNDGSEFLARGDGNRAVLGGEGDDYIYAEGGTGNIRGGNGDDVIHFTGAVLANGALDTIDADAGNDRAVVSLSDLAGGEEGKGIEYFGTGRINYAGDQGVFVFGFEEFEITGTQGDDFAVVDPTLTYFDGGAGRDVVRIRLANATSDVTVDLTYADQQLVFEGHVLRNVEGFTFIETGSGDDIIRVNAAVLGDGIDNYIHGRDGYDRFFADFSEHVVGDAAADQAGVSFITSSIRFAGELEASIFGMNEISLTGSRYGDFARFDEFWVSFDGQDGFDTVDIRLFEATTDVTIDFFNTQAQINYRERSISNVENFSYISTGSGDDLIRLGASIIGDGRENDIYGRSGFDRFEGDFSAYDGPAPQGGQGLRISGVSIYWDDEIDGRIFDFEEILITGTAFDDFVTFDERWIGFDGVGGMDRVNLQLTAVDEDTTFDLSARDNQLVLGDRFIRNAQLVSNVETGDGNDVIALTHAIIGDGRENLIDANRGFDVLRLDLSGFEAGGIVLNGTLRHNDVLEAFLFDFEQLEVTGTRFDDFIRGDEGNDNLAGGDGSDRLRGQKGDDAIDGGSNVDTALFTGRSSAYTITQISPGVFEVAGIDGTDTLTNVEYAAFDNETIRLLRGEGVSVSFDLEDPAAYQSAMSAIRDFDGNALGGDGNWLLIGSYDINGDGDIDNVLVNDAIGRFATVGTADDGLVYFGDHGWAGETRVAGIYIDPLVESGDVEQGGPFDSQRRFQNDLAIENINRVLGANDYDSDGIWEVYFALNDGTAYLRALLHADGNIRYANYQSEQEVRDYLTANGFGEDTFGDWFGAGTSQSAGGTQAIMIAASMIAPMARPDWIAPDSIFLG